MSRVDVVRGHDITIERQVHCDVIVDRQRLDKDAIASSTVFVFALKTALLKTALLITYQYVSWLEVRNLHLYVRLHII